MAYSPGGGPTEPAKVSFDESRSARLPPDRRIYTAACESLTFPFVTRARRELSVTLVAQPVYDLDRFLPVGRRLRRIVRHRGGEAALVAMGHRTLEPVDLKRIDLQTLGHGLELLHPTGDETLVLPAFWRTVAATQGRFALLYAGLPFDGRRGTLLIEVMGGPETAPPEALAEAIAHFETQRLGVILHMAPDIELARRLAAAQAGCLAIDFAGVDHDSSRAWSAAEVLIATARESAPRLLLLNLRPEWARAAAACGATHAVFAQMTTVTV
ncbi:MAG: hypothetical protein ACOH1H_06655 [Brevundimonas sp.]